MWSIKAAPPPRYLTKLTSSCWQNNNKKKVVSTLSGLTMGINTLAMGVEARVQAVASSSIEAKAGALEQQGTGEGGLERTGRVHTLHKREVAINYVCGAKKQKTK